MHDLFEANSQLQPLLTSSVRVQTAWQAPEPVQAEEAEASGLKRKAVSAALPAKKRKPGKLPKGASELLNKWQAVQAEVVRPCLRPRSADPCWRVCRYASSCWI